MTPEIRAAFAPVRLWIFDLDNTLYPRDPAMWASVDARMTAYIAARLKLAWDEARRLQKQYLYEYGLTAIGLRDRHGLDAAEFMADAHLVDISDMRPDPALAEALAALPGRKVVHTNNAAAHAERVLAQIGLDGVFDAIYDIAAVDYAAKPGRDSFERVITAEAADPTKAAMFEDAARNLVIPYEMGMRTVWTPTDCEWASEGAEAAHVGYTAPDIPAFLRGAL